MTAVTLRAATLDDVPYILRRWTDALLDEAPWRYLPRKRFIDQLRTRQRAILSRVDARIVVACNAEARSHILGFCVVTARPGAVRLEAVYVVPAFRCLGERLGTSMVRALYPAVGRAPLICPHWTVAARALRDRWLLVEATPATAQSVRRQAPTAEVTA
jgi:hypothetical protein